MGEMLMVNTSLEHLNLFGNNIGSDGAKQLARALCTNCTLQNLDLRRNRLKADCAEALSEALRQNKALRILDLWGNSLGYDGIKAIARSLPNGYLETFDLSTCLVKGRADGEPGFIPASPDELRRVPDSREILEINYV